jgi:DNA helicase-2/ATP-dependent DNA helicase PcrA
VNPLQFRLLEAWRGDRYDVTAVGDPQQAIYGWNGADAGFLLDIHRHWPPAEVIELQRSYRSTPEILDGAAAVLRGAKQAARAIEATRPAGPAPHLSGHADDRAEAIAIARAARLAHAPGRPWAEQAVLVRTHAQTHLIVEAMREGGIPHRVRGGAAFLDRSDIRRTLRELRSSTVPLGTALADLELLQDEHGPSDEDIDAGLLADDSDARSIVLERHADERAALGALLRMGRDYLRLDPTGGADSFARWLSATVQAAKGLEWAVVHLAGVEDGYVPIAHARTAAARAEEARLLYVAMTRAQRDLRITWADHRTFAARVVDRRRSPLLDPLVTQAAAHPPVPAIDAPVVPPVPDWPEQLAEQRHRLHLERVAVAPELEALKAWRDIAARAARIAPDAVLSDRLLARIAAAAPQDIDQLGAVPGVGTILARRFGEPILAALAIDASDATDHAETARAGGTG